MRSLAGKIADRQKEKGDVTAVLLFGSVAKGNIHPESDIDLAVVKATQEDLIERRELTRDGQKIDLWEHSLVPPKRTGVPIKQSFTSGRRQSTYYHYGPRLIGKSHYVRKLLERRGSSPPLLITAFLLLSPL